RQLQEIIPLKLEIIVAKVRVPAAYTGQLYGKIVKMATMRDQKWLDDGSLEAVLEVPAGVFLKLNNMIVDLTRGMAKLEILTRKTIQ
ncbi:MAG: SBDS family ribosome assembly factor, partial [Candidatus Njordarchaeota archaeon]